MKRRPHRFRGAALAAFCAVLGFVLFGAPAQAEEYKVLTTHKKMYIAIGSGAALAYYRVTHKSPLRVEVVGPATVPVEVRCALVSKKKKNADCRVRVRLGGNVLGRLSAKARPDRDAQFQDLKRLVPSVATTLNAEVPAGSHVITIDVLRAGRPGVAVFVGQAPAEPIGEMLPMVPLAALGPSKKKPPKKKKGESDIELVPLVVPEIAPTAPVKKKTVASKPAPREEAKPTETAGATRADPPRIESRPRVEPDEALLALGPKIGVLLPLGGIGGDPTWLVGAEVRFLLPGMREMLAVGLGVEYYPISSAGSGGNTDFELSTWVLPITVSATLTPMRGSVISPVLGAGLGAYLGATTWESARGVSRESGLSAAFGFFLLGGLEVDLGAGGGLLAEARWARATGDLGDVVQNADLGGLTVNLRYRYLF